MPKTPSFQRPLRALCAAFVLGGVVACGAAVDPIQGSETHFLARCSAECGGGLECIAGVCTRACQTDTECTSLSAAALCDNAAAAPSCRVPCSVDDECQGENDGWSCSSASCVGTPRLLSSPGPAASTDCPTFAGGVQEPVELETSFEPVPGASNVEWAYADDSGVYWLDFDGGLHAWRRGDTSSTTLRPAPSTPGSQLGLIGDASRLYWTEAAAVEPGPREPGYPPPPGRLLSLAKTGGAATTLTETPTQVLIPLGVASSGSVLVTTGDGFVNEVSAAGELERLANIPALPGNGMQVVDDLVYWSAYESVSEETPLFVANASGGEPVRVTALPASSALTPFLAGHGVVLWSTEETRFNPLLLAQHYVMLNQNTGCVQDLPSVDLSIGQSVLDDHHVYWHSFNALGSSSSTGSEPGLDLLRVDLRSGRLERLITPAMAAVSGGDLLAQSADTLYVRVNPGTTLYALRKPD